MKILMISYNTIGRGTFIRAYELAKNLVKLGQEVTILASSKDQKKEITQTNMNGVQLIASPPILGGPFRSGFDPFEVLIRNRWANKKSFDVVHGFESRPLVIYPALAFKKRGIPLVLDWCDWYGTGGSIEERPKPIIRNILRPFEDYYENHFRLTADATTVICSSLKERAIAQGVEVNSISLLPNGVNIDGLKIFPKGEARSYFGIKESDFVIGYVGSLFPNDANLMKRAFTRISKELPNAHLLHLGLSNYSIDETQFNSERISITGNLTEEEIQLGLAACDLCWLPMTNSIANRGRSPLKFSYYLSAGKTIVITDVGDLPAYILDNHAGLVCRPTAKALAQSVLELVNDPKRLKLMAANAKALSLKPEYSWFARAKDILRVYEHVTHL